MVIAYWATSNMDPKVVGCIDSSSKEYRLTSIFGRWDRLASLVSATFKGGFFASRALLNNNVTWSRWYLVSFTNPLAAACGLVKLTRWYHDDHDDLALTLSWTTKSAGHDHHSMFKVLLQDSNMFVEIRHLLAKVFLWENTENMAELSPGPLSGDGCLAAHAPPPSPGSSPWSSCTSTQWPSPSSGLKISTCYKQTRRS